MGLNAALPMQGHAQCESAVSGMECTDIRTALVIVGSGHQCFDKHDCVSRSFISNDLHATQMIRRIYWDWDETEPVRRSTPRLFCSRKYFPKVIITFLIFIKFQKWGLCPRLVRERSFGNGRCQMIGGTYGSSNWNGMLLQLSRL